MTDSKETLRPSEDSKEIKELFDKGKILAMMAFLNENRDKVSLKMEKIILEEYSFYEYGLKMLNKDTEKM